MTSTSYSETSSYLDCRRRHYYSYIEYLEPKTTSIALTDGKIGHSVLETYYRYFVNRPITPETLQYHHEKAVRLARVRYDESGYEFDPEGKRADLEEMLFKYYFPNEPYLSNGYKVLAVEREFTLRWDDDDDGYKFVIDLILRDPHGEIVIVDHKFTGRFTPPEMTQILPQVPLYIAGIRAMGLPAHYGEYNEINMTKVKTKRKVAEAISRVSIMPTDTRIQTTFRQQVEVAREIGRLRQMSVAEAGELAYRSIDKIKCGMCSFKSLCIGELAGANTQLIRRTDYQPRTRRTEQQEAQ